MVSKKRTATISVISSLAGMLIGVASSTFMNAPKTAISRDFNNDGLPDAQVVARNKDITILYGQPDGTYAITEPTMRQLYESQDEE